MKKVLKLITSLILATLITACACSSCAPAQDVEDYIGPQQAAFFNNLKSLCGKTFVGKTVYPEDPDHDFAGKKLVATVESCGARNIAIPFSVGEDTSRTWVITATYDGLLFKHFHQNPDGSHHDVSFYGGFAGDYNGQKGTAYKQYFPADEQTAEMIPAAKTNAWMMEFNPETKELTYYLERHGEPRYKAVLKLEG